MIKETRIVEHKLVNTRYSIRITGSKETDKRMECIKLEIIDTVDNISFPVGNVEEFIDLTKGNMFSNTRNIILEEMGIRH
ncbi:MAG: hypothetical protein KJI69_04745 [Patescibacteria group bacterium]|nr:hypothetical protein [Patescibacteria group bacterium]